MKSYYCCARYYDPAGGQFIGEDPIKFRAVLHHVPVSITEKGQKMNLKSKRQIMICHRWSGNAFYSWGSGSVSWHCHWLALGRALLAQLYYCFAHRWRFHIWDFWGLDDSPAGAAFRTITTESATSEGPLNAVLGQLTVRRRAARKRSALWNENTQHSWSNYSNSSSFHNFCPASAV